MEHSPGFLKLVAKTKKHIKETTIPAVRARLAKGEKFRLIDVREDREWHQGHIPGAVHVGRGVLERDIEKLVCDPKEEIVLYCGGGFRSALAAESLQKMGYQNAVSMDGGWRGWVEAGGEVAKQ